MSATTTLPDRSRLPVRLLLAATLLALMVLGALAWLVPPRPPGGDGPIYVGMVRDLESGTGVQAHRILGPWIVARLGVEPDLGFRLMTYASLLTAGLCVFGASLASGLSRRASLLSLACVFTTWATIGNLWDYHLVDAFTWALVAAAWWALAAQRLWLVAALVTVGSLVKEVAALTALAGGLSQWSRARPLRSTATLASLLVFPGAALVALAVWSGLGGESVAQYWQSWLQTIGRLGARYLAEMTFNAYGIHWLLAARGLLAAPAPIRRRSLALLVVGLPLLSLGTPERMAEFVFPAIATLAAVALSSYPVALAAAILVGNGLFITHKASGLLTNQLATTALIAGLGLVAIGEVGALAGRASPLLRAGQQGLGALALALLGGLYLSIGAPHGGFRPISVDPASIPRPPIDLHVVGVRPGVLNGEPAILGWLENRGRSTAWTPALGPGGRVLLSSIPAGKRAPFVAAPGSARFDPSAQRAPPSGRSSTHLLRDEDVSLQTEAATAATVVSGRVDNIVSATVVTEVRVVVVAFDSKGAISGIAEAPVEVENDRLPPSRSEPFRVAFPSSLDVSDVEVFAEGRAAD